MLKNPATKYRSFKPINLTDRQWPSRTITRAPIWMSTDLRDGNQALFEPMSTQRKMRIFKMLVRDRIQGNRSGVSVGLADRLRLRAPADRGGHIPDDVTIEVLTQARDDLIERTFESLRGARRAIVHLYNATAPDVPEVVFGWKRAA